VLGRERDSSQSEVARLIKLAVEQDRRRAEQRQQQLELQQRIHQQQQLIHQQQQLQQQQQMLQQQQRERERDLSFVDGQTAVKHQNSVSSTDLREHTSVLEKVLLILSLCHLPLHVYLLFSFFSFCSET
jgi:hypothetical protein